MRDGLQEEYGARRPLLEDLARNLRLETEATLEGLPHVDRIAFRVKSPTSFLEKARDPRNEPPYSQPLREIEDQVAGRVIVFFIQDLEPTKERLRATFNPVEVSYRRPERDEEFGYESHHMILVIPPQVKPTTWNDFQDMPATFELQVRTLFMHAWAEPQHDLAYKGATELAKEVRRELSWIAASAWGADQALARVYDGLSK